MCLSSPVLAFNGGDHSELRHVSQYHKRDDLRLHAYSALDLAVGVLNEFKMIENVLHAPAHMGILEYSALGLICLWIMKICQRGRQVLLFVGPSE